MDVIINGVKYVPIPDVPTDKSLTAALELRFDSDAGNNITVRDYLWRLLHKLWKEEDSFSSKRPYGNSGWQYDIYRPLIVAGVISGTLDSEGYVDTVDHKEAHEYVSKLIEAVFYGVPAK